MPESAVAAYDMLTAAEQSEAQDFIQFLILKREKLLKKMKRRTKCAVFESFCAPFGIEYQTEESLRITAGQYASLRKNGLLIEDDDILIGSPAIAKNPCWLQTTQGIFPSCQASC